MIAVNAKVYFAKFQQNLPFAKVYFLVSALNGSLIFVIEFPAKESMINFQNFKILSKSYHDKEMKYTLS